MRIAPGLVSFDPEHSALRQLCREEKRCRAQQLAHQHHCLRRVAEVTNRSRVSNFGSISALSPALSPAGGTAPRAGYS